mmetsp:Transcript_98201/g.194510  ORF Transcript_98201/g.194510 Transcript_98201/m.194510 type:complete len:471 (-) Transcript_98201:81-1493(-)
MDDARDQNGQHLLVIEQDFDCEGSYDASLTWSKTKRLWCCESRGVGCPYDCKIGLSDFNIWTKAKKQWCCENKGLACPWASTSEPFDCQANYNDWEIMWTKQKANWCCLHKALGCFSPSTTTVTTTATGFDGIGIVVDNDRQHDKQQSGVPKIVFKMGRDTQDNGGNALKQAISDAGTHSEGLVNGCFEDDTSWEPLDMPGTYPMPVDGVKSCQRKCAVTHGCVHFSYWPELGHCHLQDAYAIRQRDRTGFVSGPFKCWEELRGDGWVRKDQFTFVRKELACVDLGTLYSPLMGVVRFFPKMSEVEAIRRCRDYCAKHEGCVHFSLQFPARGCRMAGRSARKLQPFLNAVSGNWTCWNGKDHGTEAKDSPVPLSLLRRDALPASIPISLPGALGTKPSMEHMGLAGGVALGLIVAAGMLLLRRRRRPPPSNGTDSERIRTMASALSGGYIAVEEDSYVDTCSGSSVEPSP